MPRVTVLMPLFNGREYIEESLQSVQAQTYTDWEFIIVNDFGSNDGCADIIKEYAKKDPRIKLIQAETRLGLAASLNVGLDMAEGEYIARVDVDDPSEPKRLEKQVTFMDEHPEISLCSCWQYSITPSRKYIQKVAFEADELKAAMIFGCEISHCGVMFRKAEFDAHGWRYDPNAFGEDFELWTRAMHEGAIMVNIPEPLVNHRWGFGNISIAKGEKLRDEVRELSMRSLNWIGVHTENYDRMLFSGWRNRPEDYAKQNREIFLKQGFDLIQEILDANSETNEYEKTALAKMLFQRWDWIRKSCGLNYTEFRYGQFDDIVVQPRVSVVLPTFNSAADISKAIDSVIEQTFTDWELLVVNDFASDDGTAEIVKMYAMNDPRIHLIQAEERLGLAESLNVGMREARGEYIARLDADDTALPERFEKQVVYMDEHPEIGVCGTWQKHYGRDSEWIHKADPDIKKLKCKLLFWCDLCHSTLMLRKSIFLEKDLFYDPNAQAEDFDLWARAMEFTQFANIPEVLGTYNESTGITPGKQALLNDESGKIAARTLERTLDVHLDVEQQHLLNSWINPLSEGQNREEELIALRGILIQIWKNNNKKQFFDKEALLQILAAKWFWTKDSIDWQSDYSSVRKIDDVFEDRYKPSLFVRYQLFRSNNPRASVRAKKITKRFFRPLARLCRRITKALLKDAINEINQNVEHWTWDRYERTNKDVEHWTWDRYKRTKDDVKRWTWERYKRIEPAVSGVLNVRSQVANVKYEIMKTPFIGGKIRIVFLFQIASFWPSWESVYNAIRSDDRFDVRFLFLNETVSETSQMITAKDFLDTHQIDYIDYCDFDLDVFKPHIIVLQTPYDKYHRIDAHKSFAWKEKGYRIIYIPYGIEISDTEDSHKMHFEQDVVKNAWRIYTFSEAMRSDYRKYCINAGAVRVMGHPKFDSFFHQEDFPLWNEVKERAAGRKICLWKVHFPKVFVENGIQHFATPDLNEYIAFANYIVSNHEIFYIFMPHPKFFNPDGNKNKIGQLIDELIYTLQDAENVYIDQADDYRNSLMNADFIIVDRSAVMIEAAAADVPVLYMSNEDYYEPLTAAVTSLVESYEQGQTYRDMVAFVQRCCEGLDIKHEERNAAFHQCIPYFDGECAERIKEDIIQSLETEQDQTFDRQLLKQTAHLEARLTNLEEQMAAMFEQKTASVLEKADQEMLPRIDKFVEHWTREQYANLQQEKEEMLPAIDKSVEHWTWERYKRLRRENEELRRQIDFSYRDIMIILEKQLEFVGKHNLELHTNYPIAAESLDTLVPHGTIQDNTRYPRFIKKCETLLGQDRELSFLDLGCSGGGMVLDAILRGHLGIGLEGSDASLNAQRAEWRLLRDNLFTCDISKPFALVDKKTQQKAQFHIITAWEVMEHIAEKDLPQLFINIKDHLLPDGYFIASIANYDDIDPETGINWHVTVHPYEWWKDRFENAGFSIRTELIDTIDLARGGYNPPNIYMAPSANVDKERCFHVVAQKAELSEEDT